METLQVDIYRLVSIIFMAMGVVHIVLLALIYFNTVKKEKVAKIKAIKAKYENLALFALGLGAGIILKTIIK